MSPRTILVVDDDPHIREVVVFALRKAGFEVREASNGQEALERFRDAMPSLVVLDVLMPEMNGTDVCRAMRQTSSVPIVFLTSQGDEVDRIVGLELGGDDYVTKPFSPRELVARVRAVLRRTEVEPRSGSTEQPTLLRHGALELDTERYEARWNGMPVVLTATELAIVRTLLSRPERVFARDHLMAGAYGDDTIVSDRTIDSHVRRVRAKFAALGGDPIETVHGIGYKLRAA